MAYRSKAYFLAKFISNYTVQHEDMTDLADSALFYSDDVGFANTGAVFIQPSTYPSDIDASNCFLIKAPLYIGPELIDLSLSSNLLTSLIISPTLINLVNLDASGNFFTSISIPAALVSLQFLNFSSCNLLTCILPSTLAFLNNLDLSNNGLTIAGIESILTALTSNLATITIDLSGGTNAAKSTWTVAALAAEAQIILNGGLVFSNP